MKQYQEPPGSGKRRKHRDGRNERKRAGADDARAWQAYAGEALERMRPLVGEILATAIALLQERQRAGTAGVHADLDSLLALAPYLRVLERRFDAAFLGGVNGGPAPSIAIMGAVATAPVAEPGAEQSALAQQTIEALNRRFSDPLRALDVRLESLCQTADGQCVPQPFHPRVWVEAILQTFPASECSAQLQGHVLRLFEALAQQHLSALYAWLNTQLAQAGHGRSAIAGTRVATRAPVPSEPARRYRVRGEAIRQHLRQVREASAENVLRRDLLRELTQEEFAALLYLLQSSPRTLNAGAETQSPFGNRLREAIWFTASRLGIDPAQTRFDPAQADAIDITTRVFERMLADDALNPSARARLEQLSLPYLRLLMRDPYLLDPPEHPLHTLFGLLMRILEGNPGLSVDDQRLHLLADETTRPLLDGEHMSFDLFQSALAHLQHGLTRHFELAQAAEQSARHTVETRERLQLSRREADARLAEVMRGRQLLPAVAAFLSDQWRQSMIRCWLRDGGDSQLFADTAALGHALVAIDQASAQARGSSVANELVRIEPQLRECCEACGLDAEDTERVVSNVVAELATPDGKRATHEFMPLAMQVEPGEAILPVGTELLLREADGTGQRLRVAWHSANSGTVLLVDRHGRRQAVLSASELKQLMADRRIELRPQEGPVEAVLAELAAAARADAMARDPLASSPLSQGAADEHTNRGDA